MYKKLYLLSGIIFWAHGALIDMPAEVLFAWKDRTTLPNEQGETFTWTKEAAREHWNRIFLAGELKFSQVRDMVLVSCEQLPKDRFFTTLKQLNPGNCYVMWSPQGNLAVSVVQERMTPRSIDVLSNSLDRVEWSIPNIRPIYFAWNSSGDKFAVSHDTPTVSIYNNQGMQLRAFPRPLEVSVQFAWMGNNLAFGAGRSAKILDTQTGKVVQTLGIEGRMNEAGARYDLLAWNEVHKRLVVYTSRSLWVYNTQSGLLETTLQWAGDRVDPLFVRWDNEDPLGDALQIGAVHGNIFKVNIKTQAIYPALKLPGPLYSSMAMSADGKRIATDLMLGGLDVWASSGEVLRKYFAHDIMQRMRERDAVGKQTFTAEQAYAQMLMVALFFDLKKERKALKISEVVKEINKRADKDITTVEELAEIRKSFPHDSQVALQNVFNISKE